jgi:hypothetical protein
VKPVESGSTFPVTSFRDELIFAPSAEGLKAWFDPSNPQILTADLDAPALPDTTTMAQSVRSWTAPGVVWEGLFHQPEQKSERMRMTFTEKRDEGQYVRAVVESLENPSLVSVFEGTVKTSLDALYGQPIRLKRDTKHGISGSSRLFGLGAGMPAIDSLLLTPVIAESVTLHAGGLELKPVAPIQKFESNRTQWEAALTPGTRWTGKLLFGDAPQQKITVTIAEVRDELSYVRLLVEDNEVRTRCRVLEGTLNRSDALVDGYALTLSGSRPATQPWARRSAWGGELFGVHPDKHQFRLTADGTKIIGRTDSGELIELTRDEHPSSIPLEKESAAAHWRQKIVKGARWRGSLYNSKVEQKTDVELEITSDVDETGNLTASIRIPKGPKGRIDFKGVLRLDDPENSNAFALDLEKLSPGVDSPSPVFGRYQNIHVHFRMGTNAGELLGYSDGLEGIASPYEEVLELLPVEAAPADAAGKNGQGRKKSAVE